MTVSFIALCCIMYCFVLLITLLPTISDYVTVVHNTHYANMNEIQKCCYVS